MSGLEDDLAELENEAPDFFRAIHALSHEIFDKLQTYKLVNGSEIDTQVLALLTLEMRHRVLGTLNGRYFERLKSHTQHKVVWEPDTDKLYVIIEEMSSIHICIPQPE